MIAPNLVTEQLRELTKEFLLALREGNHEHIWDDLIPLEAARFLSTALWPINAYRENEVEKLFNPIPEADRSMGIEQALAFAFQMDVEGMRSGFFEGLADGLESTGWYEFSDQKCWAFVDEGMAVLFADTSRIPLMMPFVLDHDGTYRVDLVAVSIFSMTMPTSVLYQIGVKALEAGRSDSAVTYFELVANLAKPYYRLRRLVLDHPVGQTIITEERKRELIEEEKYVLLGRDQVLRLLSKPETAEQPIDVGEFLANTFNGYADIPSTNLGEQELDLLYEFDDDSLRKAIAKLLLNVDPVAAQREAAKPHSPAEIADMELPVTVDGRLFYLCLPFKSGVEIRRDRVPVDVAYQITRPFMYFPNNCIVIFITAKPCSQYLLNYIKTARGTQGWAIEVIQYQELGKLLKVNGLLET